MPLCLELEAGRFWRVAYVSANYIRSVFAFGYNQDRRAGFECT